MNTYIKTFTVLCPNDSEEIEYTLTIENEAMIQVESINEFVEEVRRYGAEYHETIANILYASLPGKHTLTAVHQGVRIETVRGHLRDEHKLEREIESAFHRRGMNFEQIARDVMRAMK